MAGADYDARIWKVTSEYRVVDNIDNKIFLDRCSVIIKSNGLKHQIHCGERTIDNYNIKVIDCHAQGGIIALIKNLKTAEYYIGTSVYSYLYLSPSKANMGRIINYYKIKRTKRECELIRVDDITDRFALIDKKTREVLWEDQFFTKAVGIGEETVRQMAEIITKVFGKGCTKYFLIKVKRDTKMSYKARRLTREFMIKVNSKVVGR